MKNLKNLKTLAGLVFLAFAAQAQASTVAIIDSGTDMEHQDIAPKAWINAADIADNNRDEDGNGYQDDIYGWNFAEGNNQVIDYSYLGTLTSDIRRFFAVQTDILLGQVSQEDLAWARSMVQNEEFLKQIQIYGNFMHGTHVGGIAINGADNAKLMAVKLIPTEVKLPGQEGAQKQMQKGRLGMFLLKQALGRLAKEQMKQMEEIAAYVGNHEADVANGSFGTGFPQAKTIVEALGSRLVRNITEEQIEEATKHFINTMVKEGKKMVAAAPKTLFVFASGNDGLDNDAFPASPTNISADNVISVAATLNRNKLAPFSNFGRKNVDVAAPGVSIESAVPGNEYLRVSGTSQAAPYVARVAAQIKDANPALSPKEIKKILMKTVDFKDFLQDRVVSNGIVNADRGVRAATLAKSYKLTEAIEMSRQEVADVFTFNQKSLPGSNVRNAKEFVLPLQSSFIIKN